MKKDKLMVVIAFVLMFLISGGLAVYAVTNGFAEADDEPEDELVIPAHDLSIFDYFERYATDEQKQALADSKDYGFGPKFWYERQIRIILGEIPEDSPRITLEQARKICSSIKPSGNWSQRQMQLVNAFRKYAVPDYDGGSGISRTVFLLDDEPTGIIRIVACSVTYYDLVHDTQEVLFETPAE